MFISGLQTIFYILSVSIRSSRLQQFVIVIQTTQILERQAIYRIFCTNTTVIKADIFGGTQNWGLIAGKDILRWGDLHWHNVHAKFGVTIYGVSKIEIVVGMWYCDGKKPNFFCVRKIWLQVN
jgi:hypothetical protein